MITITLENIESFSTSLSKHQLKWMFEDAEGNGISKEVKAQVIPLQREAAQFLLDFRHTQQYLNKQIYQESNFEKEVATFISKKQSNEVIKKWLYDLDIPLDRKVFWVNQLNVAFVMTWRMVIKFSDILFFGTDEVLWDKTMNWELSFKSSEVFHFVDNLMFDPETRANEESAMNKLINDALRDKELEELQTLLNEAVQVQDNEVMSTASKVKKEKAKLYRQQAA